MTNQEEYNGPCFDRYDTFYTSVDDWREEAKPSSVAWLYAAKKVSLVSELSVMSLISQLLDKAITADIDTFAEIRGIRALSKAIEDFKEINKNVCYYEPDCTIKILIESE